MGRTKIDSLSTEDAKRRLRETADQMGIAAWVRHDPFRAVALGFVAGLITASNGPLGNALGSVLVGLLTARNH